MKSQDFYSSDDIIRAHKGHFFDADSMRFFKSRVCSQVFCGKDEVYFVTSERFVSSTGWTDGRKFTVRAYNPATDSIRTVQLFNGLTRSFAFRIARNLAETVNQEVQS